MIAPPRGGVATVGILLDRAVHLTFARFAVIAVPMMAVDIVVRVIDANVPVPLLVEVGLLIGLSFLWNRLAVVAIVGMHEPRARRPCWKAAFGHAGALPFVFVAVLRYVPFVAFFGIAGSILAIGAP